MENKIAVIAWLILFIGTASAVWLYAKKHVWIGPCVLVITFSVAASFLQKRER